MARADEQAVKHYLGLLYDDAVDLAAGEGRVIINRTPHFGNRRADHRPNRVNVLLDEGGVVIRADLG